jgi:hypothetical protein
MKGEYCLHWFFQHILSVFRKFANYPQAMVQGVSTHFFRFFFRFVSSFLFFRPPSGKQRRFVTCMK